MQLSAGSYFGEVTMLFGGIRDRDINAKTLCVCYVVTDTQFDRIVDEYPEALDGILTSAVQQLKLNSMPLGASTTARVPHRHSPSLRVGAELTDLQNDALDDSEEALKDNELRETVARLLTVGAAARSRMKSVSGMGWSSADQSQGCPSLTGFVFGVDDDNTRRDSQFSRSQLVIQTAATQLASPQRPPVSPEHSASQPIIALTLPESCLVARPSPDPAASS
jgi:hypothetical protein